MVNTDTNNDRPIDKTHKVWSILIHAILIQAILVLVYFYSNILADSLIYPACGLYFLTYLWIITSWKLSGQQLFSPYMIFIAAVGLFNGGQLFLELFKSNANGILGGTFTSESLLRSVLFILLGISAFHLGALLSLRSRSSGRENETGSGLTLDQGKILDRDIRMVGWALFFIALLPAALLMKDALTKVMNANVFALYGNDEPTGFAAIPLLLSKFLVPSALLILAGSRNSRFGIRFSFLIVLATTVLNFALGVRSAAVMPLIAYIWLYDRLVYRIPRAWIVLSGAVIFFIVFPFIAETRGLNRGMTDLSEAAMHMESPITSIMSEVGNSMLTVVHTMELIPLVRDYDLGQGYGYALLTIVPNLFWDLHPSVAHGLAADWLTWQIDPTYASIGGGYGYSFLAEAYFNFGWYGTILLGLMGYFFVRFVQFATEGNAPHKLVLLACFLSFFLVLARGETGSIVRPLLWYSLLPYWGVYLAGFLRRS